MESVKRTIERIKLFAESSGLDCIFENRRIFGHDNYHLSLYDNNGGCWYRGEGNIVHISTMGVRYIAKYRKKISN